MSELKYPRAVYRDQSTGELHVILAKDLKESDVLERARLNLLYDETEQVSLTARAGDVNQAHFSGKPGKVRRLIQGEKDPAHDRRVEYLRKKLSQGNGNWSLGELESKKDEKGNQKFRQLTTLFDYQWGSEIQQIMNEDVIVRHDVFGSSRQISMSVTQPSIAIEVVKTHYPEEAAFAAFMDKSRREPYIVFFDVIEYNKKEYFNSFVKVDAEALRIYYRSYTYSIRQGRVFKGGQPTDITTSAGLKIAIERMLDAWNEFQAKKS
ncbi:hypothetical protein [Burkholderia gladioli]|uniref:hypothetical protein n=1 Tax=Burkholderia gladioli TaxID=28095 RepID=UPI00163F9988|nr:hypothetical protein [Burkholderia gladioli]